MSVNKVLLLGRLGQNPEVRSTQSGGTVANFSMATNESFLGRDGQREERTEWHKVVVWGRLAEACSERLAKGHKVFIEGRIQSRSWKDKEGRITLGTEILADTIQFLTNEQRAKRGEDIRDKAQQGKQEQHDARALGHPPERQRGFPDHGLGLTQYGQADRVGPRAIRPNTKT